MALPKQKKSGLRLLKHLDTSYYWKVRSHDGTMLHVIVGYENRPSCFFNIELSFVDPSLYFPWMAAAQEQGREGMWRPSMNYKPSVLSLSSVPLLLPVHPAGRKKAP